MNRVAKIVVFTILAIAAFGGVVAFSILLFARPYETTNLLILIFLVVLLYWSVIMLIKVNNAWKQALIKEIKEEGKDVITSWHIDQGSWATYLSEQRSRIKSITTQTAIVATAIIYAIAVFAISRSDKTIIEGLLWGLPIGIVLGVFIAGVYGLFQYLQLRKLSANKQGKIYMAKEAILVNNLLIVFKKKLFQSISAAELLLDKSVPVINLTVKMKSGERSSYQEYFIPFPVGMEDEVNKIIDYYLKESKP